ncbi:MAG: DUF3810 domain-containing protein [Daejeonella sp.]|uniref:DUF3810 domain-containing protein n=1 Tax=Daejeonella sp. TaxID=2805397 RepID=UPI0027352CB5|nr:DUF3810 domain-containing protein [Daejeonella sp.]MDP3466859.1 DUF3810 domain-containing protein [Daejeonella sp.]
MIQKDSDRNPKLKLISSLLLLSLIILIFQQKSQPELVEKYYSNWIYPQIRSGLQFIFNPIPFSLGDLLYLLLSIAIIISIFKFLKLFFFQKRRLDGAIIGLNMIISLELLILVFYLFWGLNYFRLSAVERLKLTGPEYSNEELYKVTTILIDSANSIRSKINPEQWPQTEHELYNASAIAIKNLPPPYNAAVYPIPKTKNSLLSPLLDYFGTAGYFNPFTGEAQINSGMPIYLKPFVACHEAAHSMGYGAEDEANFIGFISASGSDNPMLRYSAYYLAAQEFMFETGRLDTLVFQTLKSRISESFLADLNNERAYWEEYRGMTRKFSNIFYDNYLKANKQPDGMKSYNRMIILTMAYYKKKGMLKPLN